MESTTSSRLSSEPLPQQHKQPEEPSLILSAIQTGNLRGYVIASPAVHPNMSDFA